MNEYIETNQAVCSGEPVIRGTRILVKNILGMAAGGYTVDRICAEYPELDRKAVQAALAYGAKAAGNQDGVQEQGLDNPWRR